MSFLNVGRRAKCPMHCFNDVLFDFASWCPSACDVLRFWYGIFQLHCACVSDSAHDFCTHTCSEQTHIPHWTVPASACFHARLECFGRKHDHPDISWPSGSPWFSMASRSGAGPTGPTVLRRRVAPLISKSKLCEALPSNCFCWFISCVADDADAGCVFKAFRCAKSVPGLVSNYWNLMSQLWGLR